MEPSQQPVPADHVPTVRHKPGWLVPLLAFSCACTPGGFLFLIALTTGTNINLNTVVWFILAAVGGAAGWGLGKRL